VWEGALVERKCMVFYQMFLDGMFLSDLVPEIGRAQEEAK
jgi:hypothetical protein